MLYVLTHEYYDKSAFRICGVTDQYAAARAWFSAGEENKVYEIELNDINGWAFGHKPWTILLHQPQKNTQKGE